MNNIDSLSATPDPLAYLREVLQKFFNLSELKTLCANLQVDYENLEWGAKTDFSRELVNYLERRGRISALIAQIRKVRPEIPNLDFNLQRFTGELLLPDDPIRLEVDKLLEQLRKHSFILIEWKELHKHMNSLLTTFDTYGKHVERLDAEGGSVKLRDLQRSWNPVKRDINKLLDWAEEINYIGERFSALEGSSAGEPWAREINQFKLSIDTEIWQIAPNRELAASQTNSWWNGLYEETSKLDNTIKQYLYLADEKLRESVANMHNLSSRVLWSK